MKVSLGTTILTSLILLSLVLPAVPAAGQIAPGAVIVNTAQVTYTAGDQSGLLASSNTVDITVVFPRSPSNLEFMRAGLATRDATTVPVPTTFYSASGLPSGPFLPLDPPTQAARVPLDLSQPLPLTPETLFHQGEPLFLLLDDPDQNRDSLTQDTVLIEILNGANGDRELLRLTETEAASGRFVGYIQTLSGSAPQTKDGILTVQDSATVTAGYTDPFDEFDQGSDAALIDPVGLLFDYGNQLL